MKGNRLIINLDYIKAKKYIWDYKEYMAKYGSGRGYRLIQGAPKLINVNGHYVEINKLPEICVNRNHKSIVNKAVTEGHLWKFKFIWTK